MYQKIKCAFFNILLFCFGFGLFLFNKVDSYAFPAFSYTCVNGNSGFERSFSVVFQNTNDSRICFYVRPLVVGSSRYVYTLYSNDNSNIYFSVVDGDESWPDSGYLTTVDLGAPAGVYAKDFNNSQFFALTNAVWSVTTNPSVRIFDDLDVVYNYILTGEYPLPNYDSTLQLDSFKVSSWNIGNLQWAFKSKFDVKWSDSRISFVQVRIKGTAKEITLESSLSPYSGKFQANEFVFKRGDVIHLIATPFKSDGSYGESLYYTVTYDDNVPFSNTYRKLVNNNVNDNTLTIPFSGTSGNDNVSVPVDGVSTNVTYKVNYNPVTNEYNTQNVYEIYYSPVVVYPDDTSENEVDETQEVIINNYNTTNYYQTVKNIDTNFDIDITDVSSGDIQNTYDDIGDFFKGFGGFVGKLALLFNGLFPFLSPTVSVVLVTMVGIIAVGAVVILFLKIFHIL